MHIKYVLSAAATALTIALASSPAFAALSLPGTNTCGLGPTGNCLQFSDFTVYSLDLLNYKSGNGVINNQNLDPYFVGTNGTDIHNALVVATGVNGTAAYDNTDLIGGGKVDNAYQVPNSGGGTIHYLIGGGHSSGEGGAIPGNTTATWDVDVAALVNYIGAGNQLGFFFNLNQNNSDNTYLNSPEDALGWLKVTLTDTTTNTSRTFYLNGNNCDGIGGDCPSGEGYAQNPANNSSENVILPNAADKWAYVHGEICADPTLNYTVTSFGACGKEDKNHVTIKQNLGTDNAAFALYSEQLQYWLTHGTYNKMSVDLRMAGETNGFEQLIIGALDVPEPLTVTLFGTGLLGLTMLRRRRKPARA